MNSITVAGRLVKDPEKKTINDKEVTNFTLAMDAMVKGEKVGMFFDCAVWGARAGTAAQYMKKGSMVTVVGKLMPPYVKDDRAYQKVDVQDFTLPPKPAQAAEAEEWDAPAPARQATAKGDEIPF